MQISAVNHWEKLMLHTVLLRFQRGTQVQAQSAPKNTEPTGLAGKA